MSKKLDEYTKEELLAYVRKLQKDTRFGLVWNPKEEQVALDCDTKVPVLQEVHGKTITKVGDDEPTHLLIEGDNYHSLSVLNYTHSGKVDIIYIDPPYNTGNKDFIYNDHYVDKEDPYRHSEWLSFMDNRLRLAKNLLADTGVVFISIDDNEQAHLKILCDTIFGEVNFIAQVIVNSNSSKNNSKYIGTSHEYLLVYARSINELNDDWQVKKNSVDEFRKRANQLVKRDLTTDEIHKELLELVKYPRFYDFDHYTYSDKVDVFRVDNPGGVKNGNKATVLIHPVTNKPCPIPDGGWRYKDVELKRLASEDLLYFGEDEKNIPAPKRYLKDYLTQVPKSSIFFDSQSSTKTLKKINIDFDFPKATELIEYIISMYPNNKNIVVLDFFAGSGTTGHAVLKLNAQDGGKRQFILGTDKGKADEGGVNIAENVTYERINKVINGYGKTAGIPANLRYFKTDFVETDGLSKLTDKDKLDITKEMGAMIALRENSFDQVEQTDHWQTYENNTQITAVYFREDKTHIQEYLGKLNAQDKLVKLYVFGWGKNAGSEYASKKISVEDIPEPLIEVYKEIAK